MLKELYISNYLLIEKAHLVFPCGLVAVTGETGSGKSLLIKSLCVLTGQELSRDALKDPSKDLHICATFLTSEAMNVVLREAGLSGEGKLLSVRYKLSAQGVPSYYINDQNVSLNFIKEFGSHLFELHGQHVNLRLLKPTKYIEYIDLYAELSDRVNSFSQRYKDYIRYKEDFESWLQEVEEKRQNRDYLLKISQEIDEIAPKAEEEEELIKTLEQSRQFERLAYALDKINNSFYSEDASSGGLLGGLARLKQLAEGLEGETEPLDKLSQRVREVYYELEDIAESYHQLAQPLPSLVEQREIQQSRLFSLTKLRKKLNLPSLQEVIKQAEEIKKFLEELDDLEEVKRKKKDFLDQQYKSLLQEAQGISQIRHAKIRALESQVNEVLNQLHMGEITFLVDIKSTKALQIKGLDKVGFCLKQAGRLKSLADMASGGELSRIMLALTTLVTSSCGSPCLIFDEIDAGLGGKAGASLAKYLYRLSLKRQVLVVTHLASVAAWAEGHICLRKEVGDQRINTSAFSLVRADQRVEELARMLSGNKGVNSLAHAKELLANFHQEKREVEVCQE